MRLPSPFPFPQQRSQGYGGRSPFGGSSEGRSNGLKARLLIALAIVAFAVLSYYLKPGDVNEVTGETERVALIDPDVVHVLIVNLLVSYCQSISSSFMF